MKLSTIFGNKQSLSLATQDRAERLLVESFRLLSQACARMADLVEAQRLSKSGYEEQDKFLRRLDRDGEENDQK